MQHIVLNRGGECLARGQEHQVYVLPSGKLVHVPRLWLTHQVCLAWVARGLSAALEGAVAHVEDEVHVGALPVTAVIAFDPLLLKEGVPALQDFTFVSGVPRDVSIQNLLEIRKVMISS